MLDLRFGWNGSASLEAELMRPILCISAVFIPHGEPESVTVWRTDGTGIRIESQMHDVADRLEIGVLQFSVVQMPRTDEQFELLPADFASGALASKLVLELPEVRAESGLRLWASDSSQLILTSSAHPYMLSLGGAFSGPYVLQPEYELCHYARRRFSE